MGLINLAAGLSAAGAAVAQTAGNTADQLVKSDLEQQKIELMDQLTTARDTALQENKEQFEASESDKARQGAIDLAKAGAALKLVQDNDGNYNVLDPDTNTLQPVTDPNGDPVKGLKEAASYLQGIKDAAAQLRTQTTADSRAAVAGVNANARTGAAQITADGRVDASKNRSAGATQQLAQSLIDSGAAPDMSTALQIVRDPAGKNAQAVTMHAQSLAVSAAKADPKYQSDPVGTLQKWEKQFGVDALTTPGPASPATSSTNATPAAPSQSSGAAQGTQGNPYQPTDTDSFNAIPSGALYLNPADQQLYRKN